MVATTIVSEECGNRAVNNSPTPSLQQKAVISRAAFCMFQTFIVVNPQLVTATLKIDSLNT